MKNLLLLMLSWLLNNQLNPTPNPEKLFKTWNEKTISSVRYQMLLSNNPKIKSTFKSTLVLLQRTLVSPTEIGDKSSIEGKPLRYKFLKKALSNSKLSAHFFVIETSVEGEVISLINFIIEDEKTNPDKSHVIIYSYVNNDWIIVKDSVYNKIDLASELKSIGANSNSIGVYNPSDVILSEFKPFDIQSRYYISYSNMGSELTKALNVGRK